MTIERSSITHSFDWRLACEVGVEKAILIGNIEYWVADNERQKKASHFHEGEYWTYWTADELAAKYPYMKAPSIYRWLRELKADGWVKTGNFNDTWQERRTWYGRESRMIQWFSSPIYQIDKSSNYQSDKSNYQNDKRSYQSDNSDYQNDNSIYQNDNSIYKDTQYTADNTTQDTTHKIDVVDAQNADSGIQKKIEAPPENPSPYPLPKPPKVPITGSEFREATIKNHKAYSYAVEQLKLATDQTSYEQLIDLFLSQQDLQSDDDAEVTFPSYADAKRHFMNWLGTRKTISETTAIKSSNGNQRSNQRRTSNLRPTSLGQSEYRGTGSTCDVEV